MNYMLIGQYCLCLFFFGGGKTFELSALEFSEEPDTEVKKNRAVY